MMLGDLLETI
jgi:hypothetical protein